jgi:hypothetical protein
MSRRSSPFTGISLLWVSGHRTRMTHPRNGMDHPRLASLDPLEGAIPAARQSRFRGIPGMKPLTRRR